jgi:hypothetical protein
MKFRHVALRGFPTALPARFRASEAYLETAWEHHRSKRAKEALMDCYLAFECLGFQLFDEEIKREDLVKRLMPTASPEKVEGVVAVMEALQNFTHLARHSKTKPVKVYCPDSEMILVSAEALLQYFARAFEAVGA